MNNVINRYVEFFFVNYFSVIGIKKSNVRWDNNKFLNEFCIVFFCLDEFILLYGELFFFKILEGYLCDIWEDFVMFGYCVGCWILSIGCSIGVLLIKLVGLVGFFVRLNEFFKGVFKCGFFIVVYVVIE